MSEHIKPRVRKGRAVALAGAAAITGVALLANQGAFNKDDEPSPDRQSEHLTIYLQPGAAQKLIESGDVSDKRDGSAIYTTEAGDTASEIGEKLGSSAVTELILAQNNGSAAIRVGQRFVLPVSELGPDVGLEIREEPAQMGIGSDGELKPAGDNLPLQMIVPDVAPDKGG